jgi:predicted alpha/beta-fold hydrolase
LTGSPDFPDFRARFPWRGRHMQTARNFLVPEPEPPGGETVVLPLDDPDGDRLAGVLTRPSGARGRPLAVLVHGLTGCQDSSYIVRSAEQLLAQGCPTLRLSMRGAGPSRPLCKGYYHAGASNDLAAALEALRAGEPALFANGLVLIGYSLGGNILVKFLAEYGRDFPVRGAVTVSAPIDLADAVRAIMRPANSLYQSWLLKRIKVDILGGHVTPKESVAVSAAQNFYMLDDCFLGPHHGFSGADDYYESCKALRFLGGVAAPTLLISAEDDPWVPVDPYRTHDRWGNPNLTVLLSPGGGHVGFHGRDRRQTWHDLCIGRFFDSVLD